MLGLSASLESWDFFSRVLGSHGRAVSRGGEGRLGGVGLLWDSAGNGLRGETGGQKVKEGTRVKSPLWRGPSLSCGQGGGDKEEGVRAGGMGPVSRPVGREGIKIVLEDRLGD